MCSDKSVVVGVTGVSGFLGGNILSYLLSKKIVAKPISCRLPEEFSIFSANNADLFFSDSKVDCVVHCAGLPRLSKNYSVFDLYQSNFDNTLRFAEACHRAGVKKFVYISSILVNGRVSKDSFKFSDKVEPSDDYALSKYLTESALFHFSSLTSMEIVIIRPPIIYGANAKNNFLSLVNVMKSSFLLPLGGVRNCRSFVGVNNISDFVYKCIVAEPLLVKNKVFLISDNQDLSTSDFLRKINDAYNLKCHIVQIPGFQIFVKAVLALMGKSSIYDSLYANCQIDCSHAIDCLGWEPPYTVEEELLMAAEASKKGGK